ncbi:pentapeptide repeat-containing protein [Tateyamaria sp. ANG-S1]|uniref:pentapeptide repeat-containing protein n=1 Tax=Tateyamaria sp. ANG-S1 TaxID=1577905 RepID=UPI0006909D87|nr:pentapeptide repeat-containing protein [Tateyamaria sp. ANG-S1]
MDEPLTLSLTLPRPLALGLLTLICVLAASWLVYVTLPEAKKEKGALSAFSASLGLGHIHPVVMIVALTLYIALVGVLLLGLFGLIIATLEATGRTNDYLFYVLRIGGLTAVLGAVIALPFTLIRLQLTSEANDTALQGQITERINKATEGLGAVRNERTRRLKPNFTTLMDAEYEEFEVTTPNIEVRIGAIFALERIAQDSLRDHFQAMEILCAYVRHNSAQHELSPTEDIKKPAEPRFDIQTAIDVIGRRSVDQRNLEAAKEFRLNLQNSNLDGVNFAYGSFDGAVFVNCRFEAANLSRASLRGTLFDGSLLNHARWFDADLTGASFRHTTLNKPTPVSGGMTETFNMAKSIVGTRFDGADLTAVQYFDEPDVMNKTFGTKDTKLLDEYEDRRDGLRKKIIAVRKAEREGDRERLHVARQSLRETGFEYWSPNDANDLATNHYYQKLMDKVGLRGFPFWV